VAERKVLLPKEKMTIMVVDVEFYLILVALTERIKQILMGVFVVQDHPCSLTHGCLLGKPLATMPHLKAALNLHLGGGVFGRKGTLVEMACLTASLAVFVAGYGCVDTLCERSTSYAFGGAGGGKTSQEG
jgi:hypothetical protein